MQQINTKASGISALAQTTAVPNLHKPVRVPTYPALERTATLAFTDTTTYAVSAGATTSVVLIRDPVFPLWTEITFPNVATSLFAQYHDEGYPFIATTPTTFPLADSPQTYAAAGTQSPAVTPMVRNGSQLYWCLGGRTRSTAGIAFQPCVEFYLTANVAQLDMVVTWEFLTFDGEVVVVDTTHPRGASNAYQGVVFPMATGDYFGFRVVSVYSTCPTGTTNLPLVGGIRVGVTTTAPGVSNAVVATPMANPAARGSVAYRMYPLQRSPEESQNIIWENVRCTAAAVLFSNVTSVMNKEGTVQAARVPRRTFGPFDAASWSFAGVHPRDRYFGSLEKGFYAFTLSDAASELFRDCQGVPAYAGGLVGAFSLNVFDYGSVEYATVIQFVDYDSTVGTTLAITLDRHIEFRTTSRLFPTDYSRLRLEEYHASQMALADMGTMFENPVHLASIARMALAAAKVAWPVVRPYVLSAAAGLASKALGRVDKIAGTMSQASLVPPARAPVRKRAKAAQKGKKNRQRQ